MSRRKRGDNLSRSANLSMMSPKLQSRVRKRGESLPKLQSRVRKRVETVPDPNLEKILGYCFPSPLRSMEGAFDVSDDSDADADADSVNNNADAFAVNNKADDLLNLLLSKDYELNQPEVEKKLSKGEHVDVISLLCLTRKGRRASLITGGGDKVNVRSVKRIVNGKHVVVCCVLIPLLYGLEAKILGSIIAAASVADCPFQLVIVPKLKPGFDSPRVFDHFLSAFPSTCLAIPYQRSICRDHVCYSLSLCGLYRYASIIVDPSGKVLQTSIGFFRDFGNDAFPFTDQHLCYLFSKDRLLLDNFNLSKETSRHSPTLDEFLLCSPSRRLPLATNKDVTISVLELNKGYVGLYLCHNGDLMSSLAQLHQQCTKNERQFDILIIPLAFFEPPSSFLDSIRLGLIKYKISSWWLFPFDHKVCRRLCQLTNLFESDELIILPPAKSCFSGELKGRPFISHFGVDAYPFTRASILERRLDRLNNLTLNHLFPKDCTSNLSRLQGKKVIIYIDPKYPPRPGRLFSLFKVWQKYPDSALVYVPPKSYEDAIADNSLPWQVSLSTYTNTPFPWLAAIASETFEWLVSRSTCTDVISILFDKAEVFYNYAIVTVGQNGHILSRYANRHEDVEGGFLFTDCLRREIVSDLSSELDYFSD